MAHNVCLCYPVAVEAHLSLTWRAAVENDDAFFTRISVGVVCCTRPGPQNAISLLSPLILVRSQEAIHAQMWTQFTYWKVAIDEVRRLHHKTELCPYRGPTQRYSMQ